jgi:Taurine catabolism dioxygenase TauD, TfdA family
LTVWIRQLGHGFVGQVMGVDCRKPLSSEDVAAIHAGMNDYAVLVFRDQKLSDEEQLWFTLHFGTLEETHGGTPGPIHFRTEHEVRKLGPSIKDFSNIDASGKPLVLLCHFLIHHSPLLPQAARTPGQRGDEPEGELTADGSNRTRHMPLGPHRQPPAAGTSRVAQVFRSACG